MRSECVSQIYTLCMYEVHIFLESFANKIQGGTCKKMQIVSTYLEEGLYHFMKFCTIILKK